MTTITTIIPVFNRAGIVSLAIDSVLTQNVPPDCSIQIIVVDDASSDDLAGVLSPYGDRVTCIRHACNAGAAAARNTGVDAAGEGYIAFLDSDDTWMPGKLAAQIRAMQINGWAASCTAYYLKSLGGREIVSPLYKTGTLRLGELVWGCFVSPGSTLVCERSTFKDVGPLDTTLQRLEDWDWLLRYGRKYNLGFLAEPLARIEPSSHADFDKVIAALEIIGSKHMQGLQRQQRQHFAAGLDMERAAAYYRGGDLLRSLSSLFKSVMRSPVRHDALTAVLRNKLARS
jgi:glycosyltransferase involved in cell wall biosynthesis